MEQPPDLPDQRKTRRKRSGSEKRKRALPPFPVRLSAAERAALEAAADSAGMTLGSYIRSCVLAAPTTGARHRAPVDLTALAAVLRAFTKVAVNINQIARHL